MAHRLIGGNQGFAPVSLRNWRTTGALSQAGSRQAAMRAPALIGNGGNLRITGYSGNCDQLAQNWRRTGADWRSKGASAPVVFPPLKGGNNHNWRSAPVRLQNWSGEFGA